MVTDWRQKKKSLDLCVCGEIMNEVTLLDGTECGGGIEKHLLGRV